MNKKGLLLLSGGLDSILACKLLQEQGISLEAVNFATPFTKDLYWPEKASKFLRISTKFMRIEDGYMDIVRNPAHGHGANLNPCVDCRIIMLKLAKGYMAEVGASFIVTGEVVGERPMTQNRNTMRMIEKHAGLDGRIVRPLTAKLLPPSLPELEGVVDRELLLDLNGRGRKIQLELASRYGLKDVPTPAGGCVLTDPCFSKRVRDLIDHEELTVENVKLLLYGRHFRLPSGGKVIVGRNQRENKELLRNSLPTDYVLEVRNGKGPVVILRCKNQEEIEVAASLCAKYARRDKSVDILYRKKGEKAYVAIAASASSGGLYSRYLI